MYSTCTHSDSLWAFILLLPTIRRCFRKFLHTFIWGKEKKGKGKESDYWIQIVNRWTEMRIWENSQLSEHTKEHMLLVLYILHILPLISHFSHFPHIATHKTKLYSTCPYVWLLELKACLLESQRWNYLLSYQYSHNAFWHEKTNTDLFSWLKL